MPSSAWARATDVKPQHHCKLLCLVVEVTNVALHTNHLVHSCTCPLNSELSNQLVNITKTFLLTLKFLSSLQPREHD